MISIETFQPLTARLWFRQRTKFHVRYLVSRSRYEANDYHYCPSFFVLFQWACVGYSIRTEGAETIISILKKSGERIDFPSGAKCMFQKGHLILATGTLLTSSPRKGPVKRPDHNPSKRYSNTPVRSFSGSGLTYGYWEKMPLHHKHARILGLRGICNSLGYDNVDDGLNSSLIL
jgi:hypothetical protein